MTAPSTLKPTATLTSKPTLSFDEHRHLFEAGVDLWDEYLACLEQSFDPVTCAQMPSEIARSGWRCLDLGAGSGSIAAWMSYQIGPKGEVHAVDLDTTRLHHRSGVTVRRQDVTRGLGVDGPFDLIHARFLLSGLLEPEAVLARMVDALAPGGWLILGDIGPRPLQVVSAPGQRDADLWRRLQQLIDDIVVRPAGTSLDWAHRTAPLMLRSGLVDVTGSEHATLDIGGEPGCLLHRNRSRRFEPALLDAGATPDELQRYRQLTTDPRFRVWSHQLVTTRGRKPRRPTPAIKRRR